MITQEIKGQWVAALRSGKYVQGHGLLRLSGDGFEAFCCLGVLADIVNPSGWDFLTTIPGKWIGTDIPVCWRLSDETNEEFYELPTGGALLDPDFQQILINMNDEKKMSFAAIASYIETHLEAKQLV